MSNSNEPDMQRQVEMWVAVYDVGDAASNLRLDRSSAWRDDPLNVDPPAQVRHTATHCNTLQHTATQLHILRLRCGTLQHTATHCNTLQHNYTSSGSGAAHISSLAAVCCKDALQRTTTHYRTYVTSTHYNFFTARHCKTLEFLHSKALQGTARKCKEVQGSARKCKEVQHCNATKHSSADARH